MLSKWCAIVPLLTMACASSIAAVPLYFGSEAQANVGMQGVGTSSHSQNEDFKENTSILLDRREKRRERRRKSNAPGTEMKIEERQARQARQKLHRQQKRKERQRDGVVVVPNEDAAVNTASWNSTAFILQYGKPRTATTLQFITLCASSCLKHGPATACVFVPAKQISAESRRCLHWTEEQGPLVCKSHLPALPARKQQKPVKVPVNFKSPHKHLFVTGTLEAGDKEWQQSARAMELEYEEFKPNTIDYVALTDSLGRKDDPLLLRDYANVLSLSEAQVATLSDFLEAWDKLRVCCGAQMSKDYRTRLNGIEYKKHSFTHNAAANHVKASDLCESYDMDAIERKMMSTEVYKTCGHNVELIRKLSTMDGPLDGTYCSRALAATKSMDLIFNDKRYENL